ncbi:MAG TPA: hypothetical protein VHW00_01110 [Thermoanaerobaculia bacterium]|nr:hypothetical protein [Thermoanaerobaculia bacterium]
MTERRIVLIRHGRSAHVHAGWIDYAGFLRWRESYEAAGIVTDDLPPRELQELAAGAGILVSSDIRRAIESTHTLAPHKPFVSSPLLRELELTPPNLGRVQLPLAGWALAYGVRMLFHKQAHITPAEHERAREAAQFLTRLAAEHELVVALTHATFRSLVAKTIAAQGWQLERPPRHSSHWSAWVLRENGHPP